MAAVALTEINEDDIVNYKMNDRVKISDTPSRKRTELWAGELGKINMMPVPSTSTRYGVLLYAGTGIIVDADDIKPQEPTHNQDEA